MYIHWKWQYFLQYAILSALNAFRFFGYRHCRLIEYLKGINVLEHHRLILSQVIVYSGDLGVIQIDSFNLGIFFSKHFIWLLHV